MGAEQVLRDARRLIAVAAFGCASVASAAPAPRLQIADLAPATATTHEKVAIVDLGPGNADARRAFAAALIAGGVEVLSGDGVDAALGGDAADRDAGLAAIALDDAQHAFGALDCGATTTAAQRAIQIGAARQAGGLDEPELPRAWAYVLLCADRGGDLDAAMLATSRLRALGADHGGALDAIVPAAIWARYPDVDAASNREIVAVEIRGDVDGAAIWIDHQRAGTSPMHAFVGLGVHEVAVAAGTRRGAREVAIDRKAAPIAIAMTDQGGPWVAVATRVAHWRATTHVPSADEIAALLAELGTHVAIVRRDDDVVVWTRFARAEPPHLASGENIMHVSAPGAIAALIHDRVTAFNDHAPDPDAPLLVETPADRMRHDDDHAPAKTRWWVYATIAGAVALGAIVVYAQDRAPDTQHVELHYP